jgi:hypothetical protein
MANPFQDKLVHFIGNPSRGSRQDALNVLFAVGGVPDERITTFTHYTVAFNGTEGTADYEKAVNHDRYGRMILLSEEQFFNVLEGKADLPVKKEPAEGFPVNSMSDDCEADTAAEFECLERYVIAKKRVKYAENYCDRINEVSEH